MTTEQIIALIDESINTYLVMLEDWDWSKKMLEEKSSPSAFKRQCEYVQHTVDALINLKKIIMEKEIDEDGH